VLFDRMCQDNGVKHLLTAPRSPTTTGKIERFHKTLRAEFLSGKTFASIDDAQVKPGRGPTVTRRVSKNGLISFAAASYRVGVWLAGENVTVVPDSDARSWTVALLLQRLGPPYRGSPTRVRLAMTHLF
jgi:hypothetical protein